MPVRTEDPRRRRPAKRRAAIGTAPSQPIAAPPVAAPTAVPQRKRVRLIAAVAAALVLVALVLLAIPALFWTYHVQRAGALMSSGMRWPTPRLSDSLPTRQDDTALSAALDHLTRASYWRPDDPLAYHMSSQIYAAQNDWPHAVTQLDDARKRDPRNLLLAWESGLMYEQMQRAIERAPHISLMDSLAQAHLVAPGQLIKSQFCREGGASTCYFGQTAYALPYADSRDTKAVAAPVLFLHPPAQIEQTLQIPADSAALEFMIGLDPAAHDWQTDGAAFQVSVVTPGGAQTIVQTLAVDGKTARSGWVRGWADLSPWAGQMVTLVLRSEPGPSGDITDDWYGWANVALTSAAAKRYEPLRPRSQMLDAWDAAKLTSAMLEARGDEARDANHPEEAQAWYQRATVKRGSRK